MKKVKIILVVVGGFFLIYFGTKAVRSISVLDSLTQRKTEHFLISYHGIYEKEAQEVAEKLEANYNRIRTDLNDPHHEIIRVFIHPTQNDFNEATGLLHSNAKGTSRGPNEFHFVWTNWFNSIFPSDPRMTAIHEFVHCIQLNILIKKAQQEFPSAPQKDFDKLFEEKFIEKYPQWFWEALSDYEAGIVNKISVKYGMNKNPSLISLNNSNQVYNVGYTIIEYIVEKWGKEKLPDLITTYVDFQNVLNVSQADFEKGWMEFVEERY